MTAEINQDPWATLDGLLGVEVVDSTETGIGPVAFYGRCSTEDNQDPETSHGWQLSNARKFIEAFGGTVAAEFFDVGQSRSVPWERRSEAALLLAALKDPNRGWDAVVVGEGTRCWYGNQFSLIVPKFAAYGVDVWVPELGGKFDARNPSHKMLMSVLGGMSESERQHVQARVRAAMDAQVVNEGRDQGGRAPYGYVVVDGGPHPNPRKATEGYRLRGLAIDEPSAQRAAAKAELAGTRAPSTIDVAETYARVDSLSDRGRALDGTSLAKLEDFYEAVGLEMIYHPEERAVDVTIRPVRRDSAGVRGGILRAWLAPGSSGSIGAARSPTSWRDVPTGGW